MKAIKHQFFGHAAVTLLFNALFFLFVKDFTPSRWICYASWHVLLVIEALSMNAFNGKGDVVHSYPLVFVNGIGFGVGTLLALVFIVANPASIKLPLVLFLLIVCAELLAFALIGGAKAVCDENDRRLSGFRQFRLESKQRVEVIRLGATDNNTRSAIDKLLRVLTNTQLESSEAAMEVERRILDGIAELDSILKTDEKQAQAKCDQLIRLVQTRNSILSHSR